MSLEIDRTVSSDDIFDQEMKQKIDAFLEEYKKAETQQHFKHLAEYVQRRCEALMEGGTLARETKKGPDDEAREKDTPQWDSIKQVVHSRSKKYDSLEKKLRCMAQDDDFKTWVKKKYDIEKKDWSIHSHPDMGDLAGVRIGLYFPDDVLKVYQKISEDFKVVHLFGTVTDSTRSAVPHGNQDILSHHNWSWVTPGRDGAKEYWTHSGYKSWQIVVGLKELPDELKEIQKALVSTGVFDSLKVEIQIGTIVSQAWAEIQHSIIYKPSLQATRTMKRMIDAINGLALTTEIMLEELQRNQETAKKEVEEQRKLFSPQERFHSACYKNRFSEVQKLLEDYEEIEVDQKGTDGWTELHSASMRGYDEVVKVLITKADVNETNPSGNTALHLASSLGHHRVVEQLMIKAELDLMNKRGKTPLHLAAFRDYDKVAELLITKADVNKPTSDGDTPLHLASVQGHHRVTEKLMSRAEVNSRDAEGRTPLHLAAYFGHHKVIEVLITKAEVGPKDFEGRTPLCYAISRGSSQTVEILIAKAGVDYKDELTGNTLLHKACEDGHDQIVKILLAKGAGRNDKNASGQTPLHLACRRGYDKIVKILLAEGAGRNDKTMSGKTPLHLAAERGHPRVVELLLENRVEVDAKSGLSETPLHLAAEGGHPRVVELLLKKGARMDAKNCEGQTPFDLAEQNNRHEVAELLSKTDSVEAVAD